jgi:hypothetical protein
MKLRTDKEDGQCARTDSSLAFAGEEAQTDNEGPRLNVALRCVFGAEHAALCFQRLKSETRHNWPRVSRLEIDGAILV